MTQRQHQATLPAMTEKAFMAQVIKIARFYGYLCYHTHDSRHSASGFPDLVLIKGKRLLVAELKTDKGKVTVEQELWLQAFQQAGVETHVWRPRDWDEIVQTLTKESDL